MNRNGFAPIIILLILVGVLVIGGIWYYEANKSPTTVQGNAGTESINNQVSRVYEDQYIRVTIPVGWTATEASKTDYYGTEVNCTSTPARVSGVEYFGGCVNGQLYSATPKVSPDPSAVNITKGNYILSINARAEQASGVEGGRFEEYDGGSPSVNTVIIEHPGGPCGVAESSTIFVNATSTERQDFYISSDDMTETCSGPTNGKTVWYLSTVGRGINYFNLPNYSGPVGWIAAMGYNSRVINSFPVKGSADLNEALSEMNNILKTLTINAPIPYIPPVSQTISAISETYWSSSFSEGVNGNIESCVGINPPSGTENIKPADVAMSYQMESLGTNSSTLYSLSDVQARIGTIEGMLINNGWSKCNHTNTILGTADVYQKNNELVDVDIDSSNNPSIELTFLKLKSF